MKRNKQKYRGGLRTKGLFKKVEKDNPLITVITVVYNGEKLLEETIQSVINQTYDNIEYIIIDGGSSDGTVDVIKKYDSQIDYWISEPDNGIYDAMNKGIDLASGGWINFMNAGDMLNGNDVLKKIEKLFVKSHKSIAVLYGDKMQNSVYYKALGLKELEYGVIMACHQSMFFNYDLLKDYLRYDLRYSIYGDYELVNKIYCNYGKEAFKYIHLPISVFQGSGISSRISHIKRRDKYLILYKYYSIKGIIMGLYSRLFRKK